MSHFKTFVIAANDYNQFFFLPCLLQDEGGDEIKEAAKRESGEGQQ